MNWVSPISRGQKSSPLGDAVLIALGCLLMALGFRLFFNDNHIVAGGVVGLSTILETACGWNPARVQWGINAPLFGLTVLVLGRGEALRILLGSLLLPLAILLTAEVRPVTQTPLLAAIFGGLVYGAGLGLVLFGRGSVGGWSMLARILSRKLPLSVGAVLFTLDALTVVAGGVLFGAERAMYGLIAAFVFRRALDGVLLGFSRSKLALVISTQEESIRRAILTELDRGLTILPGAGGYTGESRPVVMVVLGQAEVPALRSLVRERDPDAFIVLTDAAEVLGKGFRAGH
jgi:uncharacterized membrane-anchored protein YitT (DUF2179 family)